MLASSIGQGRCLAELDRGVRDEPASGQLLAHAPGSGASQEGDLGRSESSHRDEAHRRGIPARDPKEDSRAGNVDRVCEWLDVAGCGQRQLQFTRGVNARRDCFLRVVFGKPSRVGVYEAHPDGERWLGWLHLHPAREEPRPQDSSGGAGE